MGYKIWVYDSNKVPYYHYLLYEYYEIHDNVLSFYLQRVIKV